MKASMKRASVKRSTSKHPKGEMSSDAKDAARARARRWYQAHQETKSDAPKRVGPVFHDPDRFEIIAEAMASYQHKHQGEQQ